jgi:DNA-binding transcriptional LysR family regulator
MIELRQLRQFIAVAEELHFRRAAARLNMSQPPLTATIRRLEEIVGATLIERGNKVIALTPAGKEFLIHARAAIVRADVAVHSAREVAQGRVGTLAISYVGSAMHGRLAQHLRAYRAAFPDVRLVLEEQTTAAQIEAIRLQRYDVGFVLPPIAEDPNLALRDFDRDTFAIALPAKHARASCEYLTLADLAAEGFVMWPAAQGAGFHRQAIALCRKAGFEPNIVQEARQMHGILALVAVGLGVGLVPASMAGSRPDEVVFRPLSHEAASFTVAACWRRDNANPALRSFLDLAT